MQGLISQVLADLVLSLLGTALVIYAGFGLYRINPKPARIALATAAGGVIAALTFQFYIRLGIPLGSHTLAITILTIITTKCLVGQPWLVSSAGVLTGMTLAGFGPFLVILFMKATGASVEKLFSNPSWYMMGGLVEHLVLIMAAFLVAIKRVHLLDLTESDFTSEGRGKTSLIILNTLLFQAYVLVFIGVYTATKREPLYQTIPYGIPGWFFWAIVTVLPAVVLLHLRKMQRSFRLELELREAEGLASIGRMAASVVHEMRAPLTVIQGHMQLVKRHIASGHRERAGESIQAVMNQLSSVGNMLNDLLQLGKPDQGQRESSSVPDLLSEVAKDLNGQARSQGITIEVDAPPTLPPVLLNRQRMKQVFINLVVNAIQSQPRDGKVMLRAVYQPRKNIIHIEVADTGVGIPRENLHRIFDPFFTTKANGTGLGLAIVMKVVKEHGGEVRVESSPQGTSFFVDIPCAEPPARGIIHFDSLKIPPGRFWRGGREAKQLSPHQAAK